MIKIQFRHEHKKYIRNALLLFVVASLLFFTYEQFADRSRAASTAASAAVTPATKLVVYFFSEGKECVTCERIPVLTKKTLDDQFAKELASGEIVWQPIDVDEKRNEHFISEYGIYTKSVVLARLANGKQTRWKNLEDVWDLVYDTDGFMKYIATEVRAQLDAPA